MNIEVACVSCGNPQHMQRVNADGYIEWRYGNKYIERQCLNYRWTIEKCLSLECVVSAGTICLRRNDMNFCGEDDPIQTPLPKPLSDLDEWYPYGGGGDDW